MSSLTPRGSASARIGRLAQRVKSDGAMLVLALLTTATSANAAAGAEDAYALQLGKLINDYRTQHGLQTIALVAPLSELAREHSTQMARENRLSHDGFQQRFARARSPTCVENVGNYATPEAEFDGWRNSPIHDRNLLDARITRMGIAIEGRYVTFFACR